MLRWLGVSSPPGDSLTTILAKTTAIIDLRVAGSPAGTTEAGRSEAVGKPCSPRFQAGMCSNLNCPPEGGRHQNEPALGSDAHTAGAGTIRVPARRHIRDGLL